MYDSAHMCCCHVKIATVWGSVCQPKLGSVTSNLPVHPLCVPCGLGHKGNSTISQFPSAIEVYNHYHAEYTRCSGSFLEQATQLCKANSLSSGFRSALSADTEYICTSRISVYMTYEVNVAGWGVAILVGSQRLLFCVLFLACRQG